MSSEFATVFVGVVGLSSVAISVELPSEFGDWSDSDDSWFAFSRVLYLPVNQGTLSGEYACA